MFLPNISSDPKIWGNYYWSFIHTSSLNINIQNTNMFNFYSSLSNYIPCIKCVEGYQSYWNSNITIFQSCTTNELLFNWTVDLHNYVNEKTNKPIINYNDASNIWKNIEWTSSFWNFFHQTSTSMVYISRNDREYRNILIEQITDCLYNDEKNNMINAIKTQTHDIGIYYSFTIYNSYINSNVYTEDILRNYVKNYKTYYIPNYANWETINAYSDIIIKNYPYKNIIIDLFSTYETIDTFYNRIIYQLKQINTNNTIQLTFYMIVRDNNADITNYKEINPNGYIIVPANSRLYIETCDINNSTYIQNNKKIETIEEPLYDNIICCIIDNTINSLNYNDFIVKLCEKLDKKLYHIKWFDFILII